MTPESQIKQYTVPEFAARIRSKYPDQYNDLSDDDLTMRVLKKHPEYKTHVNLGTEEAARADVDAARERFEQAKAALEAGMSATGKTLNPAPTPGADYFRPLTTTEKAAQQRGEPVIISEAGQGPTNPIGPATGQETATRPRRVAEPPVSLAPVIQSRLGQIQREQQQRQTQAKVQQARQVRQRAQGLTLPAGQRNAGPAYQPKFGMGQPYREVPQIDKTVPGLLPTAPQAPTFEQDRAARAAAKEAAKPPQSLGEMRRYDEQQLSKEARIKSSIRAQVLKEEAEREAAAASGSEAQLLAQKARQQGLNATDVDAQVEERYQAYLRANDPEMIQQRKVFGELHPAVRAVAAPVAQSIGGILKTVGGLASTAGLTGGLPTGAGIAGLDLTENDLSRWANERGRFVQESASLPPLNAKGEEIVRGLPEKATAAVTELGLTVSQLVLMKKATGLPMSGLMALETGLKTADQPIPARVQQVAQSAAMGAVLDQHLGRLASAALFGAPTAVQTGAAYKEGNMTLEDALLETGIQAGAGFILGGKGAKELPKEAVDYTLKSPITPEPVKDVVADVVKYGKGLVKSEDGRNLSLYLDPKTGNVIGSEITPEQAKRYDPGVVTGEKRPVRNAKDVTAEEYDQLAQTLGIETSTPKKGLPPETPPTIVDDYIKQSPLSTAEEKAAVAKEEKPSEPQTEVQPSVEAQRAPIEPRPAVTEMGPSRVDVQGQPPLVAPVARAADTELPKPTEVPELTVPTTKATPTVEPPAEVKTQPSATESQLTTPKEVTDEVGAEAPKTAKPITASAQVAREANPPSPAAKPVAARLSDWSGRLRTIAQSKDLNALQSLSDEMAAHKDDPRVQRLRAAIQDELARARQPGIPERAPEQPTAPPRSKAAQKVLAQAEAPEGKTIRPTPTHRIGAPRLDSTRNSLEQQIRAYGGLMDDPSQPYKGELKWLKESGKRGTVNQTAGTTVEKMATKLAEDGYGKGVWWEGATNNVDPQKFLEAVMDDVRGSTKHYSSERDVIEDDPDVQAWNSVVEDEAGQELLRRVQSGRGTASDILEITDQLRAAGVSEGSVREFIRSLDEHVKETVSGKSQEGEGYTVDQDGTLIDPDGTPLFSRAFHGSPYEFDKFSTEKIGTGEGAQAYGYGLYFTDKKEIADFYRDQNSQKFQHKKPIAYNGIEYPPGTMRFNQLQHVAVHGKQSAIEQLEDNIKFNKDYAPLMADLYRGELEFIKTVDPAKLQAPFGGRTYEVELAPKEDEYLLWDKPLSEQSEKVKEALQNAGIDLPDGPVDLGEIDGMKITGAPLAGANFYNNLAVRFGVQRAASEYLHSLGIRGIKYLDQGSRRDDATVLHHRQAAEWSVEYSEGGPGTRHKSEVFFTEKEAQDRADELNSQRSYNYVIFSDDDVSIVEQPQFARGTPAQQLGFTDEGLTQQEVAPKQTDLREQLRQSEQARLEAANPERAAAQRKLEELRRRGLTVDEYARQGSMFEARPSDEEIKLLKELEKPTRKAPEKAQESLFARDGGEAFFSQLSRVIDQKMPNKAPSKDVLRLIESPQSGVKAEEIKWTGLDDYLKQHETVTKQEVQDFLAQNNVKVEEVEKGGPDTTENVHRLWMEAQPVMLDLDQLGFDTMLEAKQAILTHDDWQQRWDVPEKEAVPIRAWRKAATARQSQRTKFEQYVLPGGENYRELLLTLPTQDNLPDGFTVIEKPKNHARSRWVVLGPGPLSENRYGSGATRDEAVASFVGHGHTGAFKSSHFEEPNILAHVRFNDRRVGGKKTLFIEEIQSDWHQKGRARGYRTSEYEADLARFDKAYQDWQNVKHGPGSVAAMREAESQFESVKAELLAKYGTDSIVDLRERSQVPDAPFKKTWHELAMKRMLRYAAENGYDAIAWTTGEQQAERYDLSKHVSRVTLEPAITGDGRDYLAAYDLNGKRVIDKTISRKELPDYIGKEAADRLLQQEPKQVQTSLGMGKTVEQRELSGMDLKVGGEGMKGFYDQILPSYLNKYGKKWGARVETAKAPEVRESTDYQVHGADKDADGTQLWGVYHLVNGDLEGPLKTFRRIVEAMDYSIDLNAEGRSVPVHYVEITPSMKQSVMEGQPLFAAGKGESKAPHFGVEGNQISLNAAAADLLSDAYRKAGYLGKKDRNIRGTYEKNANRLAADLDLLAEQGREGAKELAKAVRKAGEAGKNKIVLYAGEGAKRHELFHEASGKSERVLRERHKNLDALTENDTFTRMYRRLTAMGYDKYDMPALVEEGAAHIAEGRYEQLGLTRDEAVEWMYKWFQSFEAKNPNVNPREFKELADEAAQARDRAYTESAKRQQVADKTVPRLQERREGRDRESIAAARSNITDTEEFRRWFGDSKVVDESGNPLVVYHSTGNGDFDVFKRRMSDIGIHFGTKGQAADRIEYKFRNEALPEGSRTIPVYLRIKKPLRLKDAGWWDAENLAFEMESSGKFSKAQIENALGIRSLGSSRVPRNGLTRLRSLMEAQGYDGIVYRNTGETVGGIDFEKRQSATMKALVDSQKRRGKPVNAYDFEDRQTPEYQAFQEAYMAANTHREANAEDSYIVFHSNQIKSATGNRGTFDPNDPNILMARSEDPWADLADLADEFERIAKEPELPEGEKPRSLPKTLDMAGLESGPTKGYTPESIVDDGVERAKQVIADKGIDGAIEFVRTGDGIEWASTGYEVSGQLRAQESQLRSEGKTDEADEIRDKRLKFLDDFALGAVERGRSIVGIKAIAEYAPDRLAYMLNKASLKKRKRGISPETEARIAKLGEELGALEERNKELQKRLDEATTRAKGRAQKTGQKTKKTDYQSVLDRQASTVLQTLKPKVGKLDLSGLTRESEKGAVSIGIPPLPGDAELIAQYAAAQLGKQNTVADLNQHLVQEFGQDIEQYLPRIRQRAYAIRQEARLAEIENSETEPKRRKTILSEIQKEIAESLTTIREAQKAQDRAVKAERAAEAKSAKAEARVAAAKAREQEHEARKQEIKEARAELKRLRAEMKQASKAETEGYRQTIKAQREAAKKAELWDTPLRNEAAEARARLKDATDPKDPQTADDLISVAAEKFLPAIEHNKDGSIKATQPGMAAVEPAKVYRDLKDEFPALVTKKNQGDLYKKGYQRIQDATAAAREAARLRTASAEARRLWDELGVDIDAQGVLIRQAEVRRQQDELRRKAVAEFDRVSKTMLEKVWMEAQAFPRSLQSSIDAPLGRQGVYFLLTHPIQASKAAVPATLRGYGSIKVEDYARHETDLRQHPDYDLAIKSGLDLSQTTGGDPALVAEEQFQSPLASRIFPHVRLSEQGYVLGMNAERLAMFSRLADVGRAEGYTPETKPEFFEEVARFVNDGTGRGNLPDAIKRASALTNFLFFSTRLNLSRIQLLNDLFNPVKYVPERANPLSAIPGFGSYDPAMRKVMVKELIRLAASLATIYLLAQAMGIKTEFDPEDPDAFLLRVRNTRYDITGGEAGTIRFLYRLMRSLYRNATNEKLEEYEQPLSIAGKFLRYKLAPLPGGTIDAITGKDAVGQPANLLKFKSVKQVAQENVIAKRVMPILTGNFIDAVSEEGWIGLPMAAPAIAGFGVSSYPDRGIRAIKNQSVVDLLESLKITSNSLMGQKTKDDDLDKLIQAKIMEKVETLETPQGATEIGKEKIVKERLEQMRALARAEAALADPKRYENYLKTKEGNESVSLLTDDEKKTLTEADLKRYREIYAQTYMQILQNQAKQERWSTLDDDKKQKVLARIPQVATIRAKADLLKSKRKGTQ